MSGNEPTWNEDEDIQTSGDIYGEPKGTPGPGDESADSPDPMSFVAPLSLDGDDDDAAELIFDEEDEDAPASASASSSPPYEGEDDGEDADLSLGNRPAEGARVVSASEIFSEDFIGAEGASDFLGLDTEFDPMPIPKDGGGLELDLRDSPAAALATEPEEAGYVSPISAPEADPEYVAAGPAGADYADGYEGGFDDEVPDELGYGDDDLLSDDGFDDMAHPAKSRRGLVVAGAFVLGLVAVGAAVYGPRYFGGGETPVEVASTGGGTQPKPTGDPVEPAGTDPTAVMTTDPGTDPGFDPSADPTGVDPIDGLSDPIDPIEIVDGSDPEAGDPEGTPQAGGTDPIDITIQPKILTAAELAHAATIKKLLAESAELERLGGSGGLLDLVWRGESVPIEAIHSNSRILTPSVGPVRVHMASLDVFDGRLYAVGENKVWIDLELGRIGLDGGAVERIERLPRETTLKTLDAADLLVGGRVRATVPGGVIYGRVRSKSGNSVTLVTDSGARITLVDAVLENVGEKKSVVLKL